MIRAVRTQVFRVSLLALAVLVLSTAAGAQSDPLALVFQNVFGPNGLHVNSDAVLPDGSTHSAHFNSGFQSDFTQFNIALTSQLTALPLPSPASGFTYAFDRTTGTFLRSTQSFGPILTDRAETIGRGKFSFGYTSQFFSFDSIEGVNLGAVPAVFTHDAAQLGGGRSDVVTTTNAVEATVAQMTALISYGVTNRMELSLAVPLVRTHLAVRSDAVIHRIGTADTPAVHYFRDPDAPGSYGNERIFSDGGSASGMGDIILRVKGTAFREAQRALAVGTEVRLPSGDARNLLGSGAVGIKPFLAFSASYGRLSPHVDLGYQWNGMSILAGSVKDNRKAPLPSQVLYALGVDLRAHPRMTLAVDLLGQRVIDSPRLEARTFVSPADGEQFPNITFGTATYSIFYGAAGLKFNVAQRLLATFNVRFHLGTAGLADRASPLVGVEYGF